MNPLLRVSNINNEGVGLLNSGDFLRAIESFQSGIALMRDITQNAFVAKLFPPLATITKPSQGSNSILLHTGATLAGLQDGSGYVYDRPLLLPTEFRTPAADELDSTGSILTSSTVVTFNFALTCHQYGKQCGQGGPLKQAAELYSLTLALLQNSSMSDKVHSTLKCLVLNNLAHLHHEHSEYHQSQHCLERLYDLIIWAGCLNDSSCSFLTEKEVTEIKLNLMHLHPPSAARAA